MKQLARATAPVNISVEARTSSVDIEDSGGSDGEFTLTENAGRGVCGSGTTRNVDVAVSDGEIGVKQAHQAGRASDKRALRGMIERLVALGLEEDGVFRHVIMFV